MACYLILAQSDVTANALNAWLELLGEKLHDPRRIIFDRPTGDGEWGIAAYQSLVCQIEKAARDGEGPFPLNEVVVLVDSVRPSALNAVVEGGSWDTLVAMLILTFPEILWFFGVVMSPTSEWSGINGNHSLPSRIRYPIREPLFDPTGLRNWVREKTNDELEKIDDLSLALRNDAHLAAAIDEERSYAYLHGYVAYRFGCRCDTVTTWTVMKERFGQKRLERVKQEQGHGYWLLLEDMSLGFSDRERDVHLLHLDKNYTTPGGAEKKGRAYHCPLLDDSRGHEKSRYRVLVTSGQAHPGDRALAENRGYLRGKRDGTGKVVFKPTSGIFDLWEKVGLFRVASGSSRRGNVPGFLWPPKPARASDQDAGHGAPGKLLVVAEKLISRAKALMADVASVEDAVRGAVLATDALELTGGRTPTAATEALSLKHRFEVLAECEFAGVAYHSRIQPRLQEIAIETEAISRWFSRGQQKEAKLNAEMNVLHGLLPILREHNRFDEEQACMSRIRHLHNTLWMRQRPIRFILWPLLRYLELLLSSFAVFVVILGLWVLGLSVLYGWANLHETWYWGPADAVSSFFAINPPIDHLANTHNAEWKHVLVSCIAIVSGFFHLGVFVSHLYSITSRR